MSFQVLRMDFFCGQHFLYNVAKKIVKYNWIFDIKTSLLELNESRGRFYWGSRDKEVKVMLVSEGGGRIRAWQYPPVPDGPEQIFWNSAGVWIEFVQLPVKILCEIIMKLLNIGCSSCQNFFCAGQWLSESELLIQSIRIQHTSYSECSGSLHINYSFCKI